MSEVEFLAQRWRQAGVAAGDTLLLHSNIKRTLVELKRRKASVSPEAILDSFLSALGPEGTLLLPLFNFEFASGAAFDIRHTPSKMGALTEAGRQHPRAARTGHPIYSFAVIGGQADRFARVDNQSGYGEDSPFGLLRQMDGKIGVLDLDDQSSMTFYHHVEEMRGAPYRYFKEFTGPYTGWDGFPQDKTYRLYVRHVDRGVLTDVNPAGELLWEAGLYSGDRPGTGSGLRLVPARAAFDFVAGIIDEGKAQGLLYSLAPPKA